MNCDITLEALRQCQRASKAVMGTSCQKVVKLNYFLVKLFSEN